MELEYKYELSIGPYTKTGEVRVTSAVLKSFKFRSFYNGKFLNNCCDLGELYESLRKTSINSPPDSSYNPI